MKKRKGRYQETTPREAKDREYTSYEDAPLRDYGDTAPAPVNLTKKFLNVFLILVVAVAAALACFYIDVLTPENISHWFQYELLGKTEGNGYPIRFNGITINPGNFSMMDNSPVYCSDTSLVVLNSNAGEYQDSQHAFANPILKTNSGYSVVFNSEATGFKIVNHNSTVYAGSAERKIFDADVSPNGTYGLLCYGDDYLANLTVYKSDNTKRYSYSFAEYYVNRLSVNRNGSGAVLSGVSARNGSLISVVYILDFNQENYLQKYEVEDSFIYDVIYLDNGNAIAVGENMFHYIDVGNGEMKDFSFGTETLTAYKLSRDKGAVISLSENPDGRSCRILALDTEGKESEVTDTGKKILSLDIVNDRIFALFPSEIEVYDTQGKSISFADVSADARKLCADNKGTVYVLGKSEISKITPEEK